MVPSSLSTQEQGSQRNELGIMTSEDKDLTVIFKDKKLISKELFFSAFINYNLTSQEILQLYTFANVRKSSNLTQEEWTAFMQIFLLPFITCDLTKDHTLDALEIKTCIFKHDQWKKIAYPPNLPLTFEGFPQNEGQSPKYWSKYKLPLSIIMAIDRDLDNKINMNEQVTMRKAIIAWAECAEVTMSPRALRCGLIIVSQGRTIEQAEANNIFNFGLGLQRKNKFKLSFPIFLLVSDLHRVFSSFDIPADNGFITKQDLQKRVAAQDLPIRLSITAADAMLKLDDSTSLDFTTFATALLQYNRFYMYTTGYNYDINAMTLPQFLIFIHDKLIPAELRKLMDTVFVNVPEDYINNAAQKIIDKNQTTYESISKSKIKKIGPDQINMDNDFSDQSFVLSFNQITESSKLKIKSYLSDAQKIMNKNKSKLKNKQNNVQTVYSDDQLKYLKERGLALPLKREFKQRAIFYNIIDTGMKGNVTFKNVNRLFRLAKMFGSFVGTNEDVDKVTKHQINRELTRLKIRSSKKDISRIEELIELIEERQINFKHFIAFMNAKSIFKHQMTGGQSFLNEAELTHAIGRMSLPIIPILMEKNKRGSNLMGKMLYDQSGQLNDILICEIDAIIKLNNNIVSEETSNVQDKIEFEDARSMKNSDPIQGEFNNKDFLNLKQEEVKKEKKY